MQPGDGHRGVPQFVPLRLQQVGRTAVDRGFPGLLVRQLDHVGVARPDGLAVVAQHQVGKLAGHHLVPAHHHVEDGLRAHNLAGGRHQRREAGVLANPRHFEQHFLHAVARALLLQLALHVGDHAAGNLAVEDLRLHARDVGEEFLVPRPDSGEIFLQLRSAAALSSLVSKPVPSSISTRLSVGLCPGPRLSELIAVSTQSAPASIAFIRLTSVTPVVACT